MNKTNPLRALAACIAGAGILLTLVACLTKKEADEIGTIVATDLRNAYLVELDNWAEEYPDSVAANGCCGYFIYDINNDSIPELWLLGGTCEADKHLAVYTFTLAGAEQLYAGAATHAVLHQGEGYVLSVAMNNGEALTTKLTALHDSIAVDTLYMGKVDSLAGFRDATEPCITLTPYGDRAPIDALLEEIE